GSALVRAGCARAVVLDRGTPVASAVHRAATTDPPRASYDETTLSAIAVPLKPRGFRFEAEAAVARNVRQASLRDALRRAVETAVADRACGRHVAAEGVVALQAFEQRALVAARRTR